MPLVVIGICNLLQLDCEVSIVTCNVCLLPRELSGTFARLCRLVDESTSEMQRDVRSLEREVQQLEDTTAMAKKLRNKAHYLANELDIFQQTYLSSDE